MQHLAEKASPGGGGQEGEDAFDDEGQGDAGEQAGGVHGAGGAAFSG